MSLRPNSHQVITACGDGGVRLWDADTAKVIAELNRGDAKVTDVAINAEGTKGLAVDANGRKAFVFSLETTQPSIEPDQTYVSEGQLW